MRKGRLRACVLVVTLAAGLATLPGAAPKPAVVTESSRAIPIAYQVDVVVVGGSTGAVAAAVEAAKSGARVFLAAPHPYLGDDMAGTLRVWLEPAEKAAHPLAQKIFSAGNPAKPFHIKKTLDEALLEAGVEFLFSCYATDVLRDAAGNPAGIVMANRAGRQAVVAKVIIDATDRAWVARMAGGQFGKFPAGLQTVRRVVIGGEPRTGENVTARRIEPGFTVKEKAGEKTYPIYDYEVRLYMKDGDFPSWAEAEQVARDLTYHPDQEFTSDDLFQIPPDPMKGEKAAKGKWSGVAKLDLAAFRPAGVPRLYVLSGAADISREAAAQLLRPDALMQMGTRVGAAAANEARSLPAPKTVKVAGTKTEPVAPGDVKETLIGLRSFQSLPTLPQDERSLPVLGRYDVVVIGGGTSGAPTGIAAGRQGAKVLVVEYLHGLGGVGTLGAISKYYHGYRGGFTAEVEGGGSWRIEQRAQWWRSQLIQANADIWFGAMGCGAFVDKGVVTGAVVATPQGRGVVLAKVVVDATGNADIAAAAGAECRYTNETDIAVQGVGLPPRELGASYTNTDFTLTDETDMIDVSSLFVYTKSKYNPGTFDMGQLVDTRERRCIVGDFTINVPDQMIGRTHPDTIAQAQTNYDTHGYTIHPLFNVHHPDKAISFRTWIPYRTILPKGLDGIMVVGLGLSAHRDSIPLVRMQPDLQNLGYAAGVAAAMCAKGDHGTRSVNIRELQKHLVETNCLPASVLTDEDSFPLPDSRVAEAVEKVKDRAAKDYHVEVAVILAHPDKALPLLRKAYAAAPAGEGKLIYAKILGFLGDPTGVKTLIEAIESSKTLDRGWNYRGMGQFGANMSPLDNLILAAGRTRDRSATPAIIEKLLLLDPKQDFSHHRAIALALEALGDPAAAAPLAEVLQRPGMSGWAMTSLEKAKEWETTGSTEGMNSLETRRNSLREIMLARALYRCGDKDGLGKKILQEYEKDLRGHFAAHAHAVLKAGAK
ncbi:MAG: FAD-dependent oxidoreductase [Candidatus Sumerlaeia bacterium]|nr:FAD-dependent oxidoreductase [Candidatus Sumerlaeia bacterium]